ncbi:PIN domain-containing protein [Sphingobium sp. YR768]|uniref:PIN domain-containing protein n=1 Tax=Sphingobium sp. YR768 TaxID=1884365 RepID=UPI0008B67A21|nr:PIN domain-containing protein [Sphingobium sp. YR768]SER23741.1 Predicted nucleic acid-binding protein, contains PIN domain [Sphingobium sp. YR768]
MPGSFLDTNVLVYLASGDESKSGRVEALLAGECTLSVQVLNEFANVARRKMSFGWGEVRDFLAIVRALTVIVPIGIETHNDGLRLSERYRFSIYDAMIVSAALLAECDTLWSEDMQDGLVVEDRLTIRNPFATGAGPQ